MHHRNMITIESDLRTSKRRKTKSKISRSDLGERLDFFKFLNSVLRVKLIKNQIYFLLVPRLFALSELLAIIKDHWINSFFFSIV